MICDYLPFAHNIPKDHSDVISQSEKKIYDVIISWMLSIILLNVVKQIIATSNVATTSSDTKTAI
jgi:hypothetical protein